MIPGELGTDRLSLLPLREEDAGPMLGVLSDPRLYTYTGDDPPTLDQLQRRYRHLALGAPADSSEQWFNWILRLLGQETPIGFVQATVVGADADIAWLVGIAWQGHGYATEASSAMQASLRAMGVARFGAQIHPEHVASQRVAAALGMRRTGLLDADGEERWQSR